MQRPYNFHTYMTDVTSHGEIGFGPGTGESDGRGRGPESGVVPWRPWPPPPPAHLPYRCSSVMILSDAPGLTNIWHSNWFDVKGWNFILPRDAANRHANPAPQFYSKERDESREAPPDMTRIHGMASEKFYQMKENEENRGEFYLFLTT